MDVAEEMIHPEDTVEHTLDRFPLLAAVFVQRGMACVGCVMAPFDTLDDAARSYGQDADTLLAELDAAARDSG
jgi:hybrid cluster-associated redox disulfide protein